MNGHEQKCSLIIQVLRTFLLYCGSSDMRQDIDGLAGIIVDKYDLDIFDDALFLFCGRRKDRFKALYWDNDGFNLLYKRIEKGKLQWPRNQDEVKKLTSQELRWLLEKAYLFNSQKLLNQLKRAI